MLSPARLIHASILVLVLSSALNAFPTSLPPELDQSSATYDSGPLATQFFEIAASQEGGPEKSLLVATPIEKGSYPVVQFQPVWLLENDFYREMVQMVASYGFIIVVPQMADPWWTPPTFSYNATDEINTAASLSNWLSVGLELNFPHELVGIVRPDWSRLAVAGHGQGGKVAYALASGLAPTVRKYKAVAVVDPVDGYPQVFSDEGIQSTPPILHFTPHTLTLPPTLIIGSGLGGVRKFSLLPPCAPTNLNHKFFFSESTPQAYHFIAPGFGYMDLLDDSAVAWTTMGCEAGPSRGGYRRLVGGLFAALLRQDLGGEKGVLEEVVRGWKGAPVKIEEPEVYRSKIEGMQSAYVI